MYLTREDFDTVYGTNNVNALLDDDGIASDARLINAINFAQYQIDRRLRNQYEVPFDNLPNELKSIALALAWYYLYSAQGTTSEDVKLRYEKALLELELLQNGQIKLDSDIETVSNNPTIQAGSKTLIFDDVYSSKYLL